MHVKKVFVALKRKKQVHLPSVLVDFKRKNKIVFKFSTAIMKLNYLVFILIMCHVKVFLDFFSSEAIYSIHLFISIFNSFPKLFEKMVCDRITPVVRPVISDAQHGFVKGRLTVSNLVQFTKGVIGEIEDGWQVDGMYTDFSKVFDRVLHDLLKFNLSILFGGSLLCWM
jgi:hypothetical protein